MNYAHMHDKTLFMLHMNSAVKYLSFQLPSYINISPGNYTGLAFANQYGYYMYLFPVAAGEQVLITICSLFIDFKYPVLQYIPELRSEEPSCATRQSFTNR